MVFIRRLSGRVGAVTITFFVVSIMLSACKASPRQTPIKLGPVDTGPGSLQAVRKQLEGSWTLVSLVTYSDTGQARTRQAAGRLTYDAYGSLSLDGRVSDSDQPGNPIGTFTGRAVIDTARQWIILQDIKGGRSIQQALPEVSPANIRRYEFHDRELRLTAQDAAGQMTAVTIWRKDTP